MKNLISNLKLYYKKTRRYLHIASLFLDRVFDTLFFYLRKISRIFFRQPFFAFLLRILVKIWDKLDPLVFRAILHLWKIWQKLKRYLKSSAWGRRVLRVMEFTGGFLAYLSARIWKFFLSLSTWKKVFASIVIFSLIWNGGLSVLGVSADEDDPIDNIATPEMRILSQHRPEIMETSGFKKREDIRQLADEKEKEVEKKWGIFNKTPEDAVKEKEAEILKEARQEMLGGFLSGGKPFEETLLKYTEEGEDEKTREAARNIIEILKSKNIFATFEDQNTQIEKGIAPTLKREGDVFKPESAPYETEIGRNILGGTKFFDKSSDEAVSGGVESNLGEIPEPKISPVSIGKDTKLLVDATPQFAENIEMKLQGAVSSNGKTAGNKILFPEALRSVDILKSADETGLKEDLIIKDREASSKISWKIKTTGLTLKVNDGRLEFYDALGNLKFQSEKPFVVDATGKKTDLKYEKGMGDILNTQTFTGGKTENSENQAVADENVEAEKLAEEEQEEKVDEGALQKAAQEIGDMLEKSKEWVLNLFSREEIEKIIGRSLMVPPSKDFDFKKTELFEKVNKKRVYYVTVTMDFAGLSFPLDLDPTILINLQDSGQATFYGDYAMGAVQGGASFTNGGGTMSRGNEAVQSGGTRVENTDPLIIYGDPDGRRTSGRTVTNNNPLQTNSPWYYFQDSDYSGGSYTYFNTANIPYQSAIEKAYVEFSFTGTEIWLGALSFNQARNYKAVIDEGTSSELTTYINPYIDGSTDYPNKFLIATGLASASHTVRVYPLLSGDTRTNSTITASTSQAWIDYFEYYTTGNELASKGSLTINSRSTSGFDFPTSKDSPAISYSAPGNVPGSTSGDMERGSWSSWVKSDFAWNTDNVPHYVWSTEVSRLYYLYDGSTNGNWYFEMHNGTDWTTVQSKSANYTSSSTFSSGQVFHLAVSWDAGLGSNLWVNNVKTSYSGTWTAQDVSGNMKIGGDEKTKLLLHADNSNNATNDVDASGNGRPVIFNGDAKISTAQSKFGGSSYYFDGTGDYIDSAGDFNIGSGDFTVDFWSLTGSVGNYPCVAVFSNDTTGWYIQYYNTGELKLYAYSGEAAGTAFITTSGANLGNNSWHHVAVVKSGSSWNVYIDGVSRGSGTKSSVYDYAGGLRMGIWGTSAFAFNGYIDELRITKGVARWTSNFTVPTIATPYANLAIAEPTILNYVLTDAEVDAIYNSTASMGNLLSGKDISQGAEEYRKLFSPGKRTEETNRTSKSLLFNYSGVQTATPRVGSFTGSTAGAAYQGGLFKTSAPTGPSTTVPEGGVVFSGTWTDVGNYRTTTDPEAYAVYTTSGNATEIWATYYANTDKGVAEYIIDEGTEREVRAKISQYHTSAQDRYGLLATGLENTTHTIKVRMLNTRFVSSSANGIALGLNGTVDRMFYFGTTSDIATTDMVVNGRTIKDVLIQDYATMPNSLALPSKGNISDSVSEGSISAWLRTSWAGNDSTVHYLFDSRSASNTNGIYILKHSNNYFYFGMSNSSTYVQANSSAALTASDWKPDIPHHIVVKWWRPTSTTVGAAAYLDGMKILENKSMTLTPSGSSMIMVGNASASATNENNDFDGAIYDLSVWSWAFDDGGVAVGSMADPTSDVGKSYSGYALSTDEDLSDQVDGSATTFKLERNIERNKPDDANWIWAENRKAQTYFGSNMTYDSANSRWYTVNGYAIYYSSGPDPEKSTWTAQALSGYSAYNFQKIYYDSVNSRWYIMSHYSNGTDWDTYVIVSDSSNPLTASWSAKVVSNGGHDEWGYGMAYDSANSRWLMAGSLRVKPANVPYYAWMCYSSGSNLSTATWSFTYISTSWENQSAYGLAYDSNNSYWYVAGAVSDGYTNRGVVWYASNPIGGTGSWTRTDVEVGGSPSMTTPFYDSTNSRWLVFGSSYSSSTDPTVWYSSGNNLTSTTWTKKIIDNDSEAETIYDVVKDPNQDKYYLVNSNGSSTGGFWPMQIASESSESLADSVAVENDGGGVSVASAKAGGVVRLENSGGADLAGDATSITIDPGTTDANTKLLLHGDGTNGTKKSFDDSASQRTLVHNGDVQLSTTQSKFGGSGYYFDGAGDYVSMADSDDWNFGSGDFTIDFWMYLNPNSTNHHTIMKQYYDANNYWQIVATLSSGSYYLRMYAVSGGSVIVDHLKTGAIISANTWTHFAVERSGSTCLVFKNGTNVTAVPVSFAGNMPDINGELRIGQLTVGADNDYRGYLDEIRVAKGVAKWTSDFSVPTSPHLNTSYDTESEIDTNGGYLLIGPKSSKQRAEMVEYSSYNASTHTFTVSERGIKGTQASRWPNDTTIEIGGTLTLSSAPEEGSKLFADYNFEGDELERDRGYTQDRSGMSDFVDYTASASTGWLLGASAGASGGAQASTQVAGQNAFSYFEGTDTDWIMAGDATNGGVSLVIVDEGMPDERRTKIDQMSATSSQLFSQLFSGLFRGYHTLRVISGVEENNSGSNRYGTFDALVYGSLVDLGSPTGEVGDEENKDANSVNDTFYYPAWNDADNTARTYDDYTRLLLHADGTNNAVSDIDYSASPKTLTFNGDAKISTAQSKFGGSSYYFDGTGDYLSVVNNEDWQMGKGDFTIDFWFRDNSSPHNSAILSYGNSNTNYESFLIYLDSIGHLYFFSSSNNSSFDIVTDLDLGTFSSSQFDHFAVVRSGSTFSSYKNGTFVSSASSSGSLLVPSTSPQLNVGKRLNSSQVLNGYIDELRITKGVARWTSNFTVPSKPYVQLALNSAISDSATSLTLDTESPQDLDLLGRPSGVVKIGSEYIKYDNIYVDKTAKTAKLLTLTRAYANSSANSHSDNDQVYPRGGWRNNVHSQDSSWYQQNGPFPEKALLVGTGTEGQAKGGLLIVDLDKNANWGEYQAASGNVITQAVKTVSAGGGKIFAGFGSGGGGMLEFDMANDSIFRQGGGNDSYTKFLAHADGSGNSFSDSSASANSITANGNVTQSSSEYKFGGKSAYFDGSGDYLSVPDSDDWYMGTSDFSIDTWVRFNSLSALQIIASAGDYTTGGEWDWYISASKQLIFGYYPSGSSSITNIITYTWSDVTVDTWYHIAAVRNGNNWMQFVNGTQVGTTVSNSSTLPNSTSGLLIGAQYYGGSVYGSNYMNGYLDEFRINKGVARWTANFNLSSLPYGQAENVQDIENYYDGSNDHVWTSYGKSGTTGTSAGVSYAYDSNKDGSIDTSYKLTSDTGYWGNKLEYDPTNDDLFLTQTNGTADQDIWSQIGSPRISADSTIDSADGTARVASQPITNDLTDDPNDIYLATEAGVKKVSKSSFSSGANNTFDSSDFSELSLDTAKAVDYDSVSGKLGMGFSGTSGHDGVLVVSGTDGSGAAYMDYFGETSGNRNNSLVSDIFRSVSWIGNLVSGYYSFAVGTDQGISLIRYLTSSTPGVETEGGGRPPAISPSGGGFLIF